MVAVVSGLPPTRRENESTGLRADQAVGTQHIIFEARKEKCMTTILRKMILRALNAATRRVQGTVPESVATKDSTSTMTESTAAVGSDATTATEPASSDGARNAAGNGEEKISMPTGNKRASRIAIMRKGDQFALIVLDTNLPVNQATVNVVTSQDPRCRPSAHYQSFDNPTMAIAAFNESLAVSRDRGWTIAHLGERNNG
jgi:hypothetical protein